MTIYSDAAGNKYLGDCRWGNHDINYPTTDYLATGAVLSGFNSDITSLLSASGLQTGEVILQEVLNDFTAVSTTNTFVSFSPLSDTIPNRYSFARTGLLGATGASGAESTQAQNRLDDGSTKGANLAVSSFSALAANTSNAISVVATANDKSLALLITPSSSTNVSSQSTFWYGGQLEGINTNFDYYNAGLVNSGVIFNKYSGNTLSTVVNGAHYIANASKPLLQTGRAAYSISCSDGQTPGAQWATDMWVYDNNATLGYPVIGRVPNMLLGIGDYTYLKPVKIQGSVFPDNGSPWYLPVGTFSGKALLMRCYSSMT